MLDDKGRCSQNKINDWIQRFGASARKETWITYWTPVVQHEQHALKTHSYVVNTAAWQAMTNCSHWSMWFISLRIASTSYHWYYSRWVEGYCVCKYKYFYCSHMFDGDSYTRAVICDNGTQISCKDSEKGNLSLGTVVYAKSFTQQNSKFEKTFSSRLISGTFQVARQSNASHNGFLCSYPSINVCLFGINCYTELISCC